jgi:hypothetical protein
MSKYSTVKTDRRTTFTTMDGHEIHFTPFSWDEHLLSEEGLKQDYRDRGQIVDCPQYTVKFATGAQQKFDHDAKSVLQAPADTPPEDKERVIAEQVATWEKYQADSAQFVAESQTEMTSLIYLDSLADYTLPDDTTAWEARLTKKHIRIPKDPEAKRQLYINTELVKFRGDQIDLIAKVTAVSMGATREADIELVKQSFLNSIWSISPEQLPGRSTAGKAEDTTVGKLDGESQVDGNPGAQTVAINEG